MENLSAYIFIAIIIVIAIIKIAQEAKRKASTEKRTVASRRLTEQASEEDGFSEWEEWNAMEEEKEIQETPVIATVQQKIERQSIKENYPTPRKQSKRKPKVQSENLKLKMNSKEEIKRAIIYSEIINRKYE